MGVVSVQLSEALEAELEAYIEEEHLDRSSAVRKLLAESLDSWRTERVLEQLQAGEVSFSRAADLTGKNVWEFAQLVRDRDINWVDEHTVEADEETLEYAIAEYGEGIIDAVLDVWEQVAAGDLTYREASAALEMQHADFLRVAAELELFER